MPTLIYAAWAPQQCAFCTERPAAFLYYYLPQEEKRHRFMPVLLRKKSFLLVCEAHAREASAQSGIPISK